MPIFKHLGIRTSSLVPTSCVKLKQKWVVAFMAMLVLIKLYRPPKDCNHQIDYGIAWSYLTTQESLIGHSGWALPHYSEMGHSSSSFWGTASSGWGSNPRPPVPMTLNILESHRGIGERREKHKISCTPSRTKKERFCLFCNLNKFLRVTIICW